jgi:hypothetical protein
MNLKTLLLLFVSLIPSVIFSQNNKPAEDIIENSDKSAYEKSINDGSQDALRYYLSYYPQGSYRIDVLGKLMERVEYDLYLAAKNGDPESYLEKYPNGKFSSEINQKLEEEYFSPGYNSFRNRDYETAQTYFNAYLDRFPDGTLYREVQRMNIKCDYRINQEGIDIFTIGFDSEGALGVGYGEYKTHKPGQYFQIRCNGPIFTGIGAAFKIDDEGVTNFPNSFILTGKNRKGAFTVSGGYTLPVFYPLWINLGAGIGSFPVYVEAEETGFPGNEKFWLKNSDQSKYSIFPQLIFNYKLTKEIMINYGLIYHKGFVYQFGIGFKI